MFTTKSTVSLYVISCLIMFVLLACQEIRSPLPTPIISTRTILESNPTVKEIWRISPLFVSSSKRGFAYLVQTPGKIVGAIGLFFGNDDPRLATFDANIGKLIWNEKLDSSFISSIVADQKRVYIANAGEPLKAYGMENGNLVWLGPELVPRRSYFLDIQDDVLFTYFTGMLQSIDAQSGEMLSETTREISDTTLFIMRLPDYDLYLVFRDVNAQDINALRKVRRDTREVIWQSSIDNDSGWVRYFPILSDNILIAVTGEAYRNIYAFDFETGQRLWKANASFVSDAAISNGKVYALRNDARLLIFDEMTGAEIGHIQFTPAETDPSSETYWVVADEEGWIFVYFSDSRELIGLTTVE